MGTKIISCMLAGDFINMFGSVRRNLIQFALNHYHVAHQVKSVVGKVPFMIVQTSMWTTGAMPYWIRVFQGDPLSVAVFNMVAKLFADPIIQHYNRTAHHFKSTGDPLVLLLFSDNAVMVANSG